MDSMLIFHDLCQAQCRVLSSVKILNFFFLPCITICWFLYVGLLCTAKATWSHTLLSSSAIDHGTTSSFLLNDQRATYLLVVNQLLFLGFANNASFVENNEYCFISLSLLCESSARSLHFRNFSDGWEDYTEFISAVNCQRKWIIHFDFLLNIGTTDRIQWSKTLLKYDLKDSLICSQLCSCWHMMLHRQQSNLIWQWSLLKMWTSI